jgi:hypothetical protein
MFKPDAKTETVKPGGTLMSFPLPGAKFTVSAGHIGLATVAASAAIGDMRTSGIPSAVLKASRRFNCITSSLPSLGVELK